MTSVSGATEPTTALRLTSNTISNQVTNNILNEQTQIASLEEQLSSGSAISQPSDNPALCDQIMQLNSSLARATQYQANATDAQGWLSTANQTMNQIEGILQNVQQSVLSVSSTELTSTSSGLAGLATQVQGDLATLTELANTSFNNRPIFGGTGAGQQAYDGNGNYLGQGAAPTRTVAPGMQVSVGVTGPQVFGSGTTGLLGNGVGNAPDGSPTPTGVLQQIIDDLQTGTPASLGNLMGTDLTNLQNATANVTTQAAEIGAQTETAQTLSQQASATQEALTVELSQVSQVNIPQATTDLQLQQTTYQAGLWAAAQLTQGSLIQFLG